MKKLVLLSCTLSLLNGCNSLQQPVVHYYPNPPSQVAYQAQLQPVIPSKGDFQLAYGNNVGLARAYQQYINTGKAPNIITDGFEQFAYDKNAQPIIGASVFELTVITLEPGENVTNVSSGDPTRWDYYEAYSYTMPNKIRQTHILIKPKFPHLSTNLVITTDKRMYLIKMVSTSGPYLKNVSFWYPDEIQDYWDNYNLQNDQQTQADTSQQQSTINLNAVNFDYSISGSLFSSPSWKPVRVFDDGTHTYIQFPPTITNQDMPALFILSGNNQELVNYRSKPPYFQARRYLVNNFSRPCLK